MKKKQATKLAGQLKQVFSEQALNERGKDVGFCKRERSITPYRPCLGLAEVMGMSKIVFYYFGPLRQNIEADIL